MRLSKGTRVSGLSSFVLGEHGENMVILRDRMRREYGLSDADLDLVLNETVRAAAEIISMKGATVHGPGASIARMVKAVLSDSREVLPASAVLNGEYGIRNVCLGVPVETGRNGFKVVQEKLGENEVAMLRRAAENVLKALEKIGYGSGETMG
jgi:malate dehydrogenase